MPAKKKDIYDRIYNFVLTILNIIKFVPKSPVNLILIRQVVRSAGSIGANASEADGAETKREFIHRFTISKKEGKEALYWLSLISDHNPILKDKFSPVIRENNEIIAIVSKIIINAKKNKD